ncbi:MAG TPA: NEW3 domain-containing protein, partial [Vicinamibacterales bacterium]|nr:NEW3 domain-containing protein [Vicinamibacterales bacterium]
EVKERQAQAAITAALGVHFSALARPAGTADPTGPAAAFAAPPAMGPVVPGQRFDVRAVFTSRGRVGVTLARLALEAAPGWTVTGGPATPAPARPNDPIVATFGVTVPPDARPTQPYFRRASLAENRYTVDDPSLLFQPASPPPLVAVAAYEIEGQRVEVREPVRRLEPNLPYGHNTYTLAVVPAIAVTLEPSQAIVPTAAADKRVRLRAEIVHNHDGATEGRLALRLPPGWTADPPAHEFRFSRAGERASYGFTVRLPAIEARDYRIEAVATAGGREYREGYTLIQKRDLETRYLYRPAAAGVRGIDVQITAGLRVGYVMGIGDDVPSGIAQLGAEVRLLDAGDLAAADLRAFDAIVLGTRAYAAREDLRTYNHRLLDYVRNGGNLIVLYNTQEFEPSRFAPYPGELPRGAEEVSEEDSPVEILAPSHPVLTTPNRITAADFQGWVEQRGSKFWSAWAPEYTPIIATWDRGQAPQKGGWLHARYGRGHYTYFAYAFHRQLPYGVPGAYRLLANLLSLGKTAPGGATPEG